MAAQITIVLLASRRFLLDKLFQCLDRLECVGPTNLLVICDGDLNLFLKTRNLAVKTKFTDQLTIRAPHIERRSSSQNFRRKRIGQLHELAKQYIQSCDYVLLVEDDGLLPVDTIPRLLKIMQSKDNVGFVSGLQVGRWTSPYIGGWLFDDPQNPAEIYSVNQAPEIISVHAAGLYCLLTRRELYEQITVEPKHTWGPDIEFTRRITEKGYNNYMDTNLVIDHYRENGTVVRPDNTVIKNVHLRLSRGVWRNVFNVQKARV